MFKYLGRMMAQDDDDVQAIQEQLRKARSAWARVGQVLRSENASPFVAARFYKAIIQAIILYGSKTWVLSRTGLAQLAEFYIRTAYRMDKKYKPKRRPGNVWIYPRSEDVLKEYGMKTVEEYIDIRRQTIATYVAIHMLRSIQSSLNADGVSARGGPYHTNGGGRCPWIWTSLTFIEPDPCTARGGGSPPGG